MVMAERFIKINPFSEVKTMLNLQVGLMQFAQNGHTGGNVIPVFCICISGPLIKLCNLISIFTIKINNMFSYIKRFNRMIGGLFFFAVDEQFCTGTGNAADIMFIINFKKEGFVGHSRFETADVADCGFLHLKYLGNEAHCFIV